MKGALKNISPENRLYVGKCCPLVGRALLTHCMQEIIVMCEGHERIWQLPQPLFNQARHCVDGIVFEADEVWV